MTKIKSHNWEGVLASPNFSPFGKQKFSVKILRSENKTITIGLALESTNLKVGAYTQATSWMLHCYSGEVWISGSYNKYLDNNVVAAVKEGDIITVKFDADARTLIFEVNGIPAGSSIELKLSQEQISHMCPAVDMRESFQEIQFVHEKIYKTKNGT